MKKYALILLVLISGITFGQEVPKVLKTGFSKEALAQTITMQDGKKTTMSKILAKHKGKIVLVDLWASWCGDCVKAMPEAEKLKEKNPDIDFIYLSLDRKEDSWKNGIVKHKISGSENYWFADGWKNEFNNYIDLNWIPRYMVINQKGKIAKYYAIVPQDPEIQKTIDNLTKM
ncbi:TlpA family protein disulfide reductase [Halpernia frigidisoli]|uniref:Thiol-disulfide isomerase or thioredoxin n=1 Tax=Halpernia frigidisoli TaxID=1125876 RepID=A0A1I3F9T0_9FLAO|nr:thioredoxin-like domain-containing protein [Halpernia frigidisoli]SFI07938.1 Thiol-disulfide isomerase or thioredoxin [Halpernia frigidisoli]